MGREHELSQHIDYARSLQQLSAEGMARVVKAAIEAGMIKGLTLATLSEYNQEGYSKKKGSNNIPEHIFYRVNPEYYPQLFTVAKKIGLEVAPIHFGAPTGNEKQEPLKGLEGKSSQELLTFLLDELGEDEFINQLMNAAQRKNVIGFYPSTVQMWDAEQAFAQLKPRDVIAFVKMLVEDGVIDLQ